MSGEERRKEKEQWSTKCHCSSCRFFRRRAKAEIYTDLSNRISLITAFSVIG
jgi:hypothetical protein